MSLSAILDKGSGSLAALLRERIFQPALLAGLFAAGAYAQAAAAMTKEEREAAAARKAKCGLKTETHANKVQARK